MVLFNDTVLPDTKKSRPRAWRWTKNTIIIVFTVVLLFFIGLTILSRLGGQNGSLERGLEDYFARAFNMKTNIQQVNYIGIFPHLYFDLSDIVMIPEGKIDPSVTIGDFDFKMHFWDMFFTRYIFEDVAFADVTIEGGLYTPEVLKIETAAIMPADSGRQVPAVVLNGEYGGNAFEADFTVDQIERNGKILFTLADKSRFSFRAPFLTVTGETFYQSSKGRVITFDTLQVGNYQLSGSLTRPPLSVWQGDFKTEAGSRFEFLPAETEATHTIKFNPLVEQDCGLPVALAGLEDRFILEKLQGPVPEIITTNSLCQEWEERWREAFL